MRGVADAEQERRMRVVADADQERRMRVLVVHNRYSSRVPSGENLAVDDEVRWLRDAGVEVVRYEVSNDEVVAAGPRARAAQAASSLWSLPAQRRMADVVRRHRPDLVHVHNLFPLLTASVPWQAGRRVPVVWTAHNQRVVCVAGTHFRDGAPCHLCRVGWRLPGVRHACYGNSHVASGLVTVATTAFRSVARRRAVALAISDSLRRWLVADAGLAPERVQVKYNGVAGPPRPDAVPPAADSRTLLFAGHLSDHKGVSLLLDAWRRARLPANVELRILGDGPLADTVRRAAAVDPRITWRGHVDAGEVPRHLADARAVIVPSVWQEPFGRSAAEALAYGRPVVTTGTGGLAEVVDTASGWITGTDADPLTDAIEDAMTSDDAVSQRAVAAQRRHAELFSPEATTRALIGVYATVIGNHRDGATVPETETDVTTAVDDDSDQEP